MSRKLALVAPLIIGIVVLVTYQPGFRVGFFNGWWYLEWVGTMDVPRYLIQFFDPRNVTQGYRPVQGLYVLLQYALFGLNWDGFYLTHVLLHAANSVLLYGIAARLSHRWRLALISSLIFAVLPAYSLAVFWHAVVDPLSTFFYLLTVLIWTEYQERRTMAWWFATWLSFIFALLSKEVAVFLPFFLFLIERWFYHRRMPLQQLLREYVPFLVLFIPYVLLEINVQSHGEFVGQFKFSVGPHMLSNLIPYLAVLVFPWTADLPAEPFYLIWLAVAGIVFGIVLLYKRSTALVFLALFAVLCIVPLLGFPIDYFNTRYLYAATMVPAVLLAALIEFVWRRGKLDYLKVIGPLAVALLLLVSSARVADAAGTLSEFTRQMRVPFRDISRQHPQFPDDTLLYFVYSPNTRLVDYEGLSFVRYGAGVKVDGVESNNPPELRSHNFAYVYYFDPTGRPVELSVDKTANTHSQPALPVRTSGPITLERYQVPSAAVRRGQALVALLEWRTDANVSRDYTVFAHLLDDRGNIVSSYDSQPQHGAQPTSGWRPGTTMVDALVLPIGESVPLGDGYRLEVGMYDAETNERLSVIDTGGHATGDAVVIEPFRVTAGDAK